MMTPRHKPPVKAFTLIELLVVVSIIGLLISIIMPSLRRSREIARKTQCLTHLRALFLGNLMYAEQEGRFPNLNNDPDDGAWQYNYIIYDGRDFEEGFGPLVAAGDDFIPYMKQLFCPVQKDPFHLLGTRVNPWPIVPGQDTRAGYGRRYHLSGKSLSQLKRTRAFAADVMHLTKLVDRSHKTGLNAVYTDGHARWVPDPGIFADNDLDAPFDRFDNPIMDEIWDELDDAVR